MRNEENRAVFQRVFYYWISLLILLRWLKQRDVMEKK